MFIRWTPAALSDFKTISHRIEHERNLKAANGVCRRIYDTIQILRRHPHSGRLGTRQGTRELVLAALPYVVVYRVKEAAAEILHIYHGAQDWR